MLSEVLKNKSLFWDLYKIDLTTAELYRQKKCPHCQGPLHYANYPRKPRGEPDGLSKDRPLEAYSEQKGLKPC